MKRVKGYRPLFGYNMPLLALFIVFIGFWFDVAGVFRATVCSALFHELGHILCYCYIREDFPAVHLTPVGFSMTVRPTELSVHEELWVAAAGPLVNLILAGTFFTVASIHATFGGYVWGCVNLVVGVLNLLPLPFLDGGRLFYLLFGVGKSRGFWRYLANGFVCVLLLVIYGVLYLNSSSLVSKISLAAVCLYALVKSLRFTQ